MSKRVSRKMKLASGPGNGTSEETESVTDRADSEISNIPIAKPNAKIVVAVDFGTTYSGFAYALSSDIEKVYVCYEWPSQGIAEAKPYCKTQTSLWYLPAADVGRSGNDYDLKEWGWTAFWKHKMALQDTKSSGPYVDQELKSSGYLATKFKLHLAPELRRGAQKFSVSPLPEGLSPKRLISDYLHRLSEFIMEELQNKYGGLISKKDVQWCVTVPALWDDYAKQQMVECAEIAGLVDGPSCRLCDNASPHSLVIVLEPEAASVYCQRKLKEVSFSKGSNFLVVDAGGGTVDLVVHEKVDVSGIKVREVACSTGDLCGGTYIDEAFYKYLSNKISCFEEFSRKFPATVLRIQEYIEKVKCSFNGESDSFLDRLEIPARLAKAWKAYDEERGRRFDDLSYDELTISTYDLLSIFRDVVEKILQLIGDQLSANTSFKVDAILVVGGFSSSPYLLKRIRERFSSKVRCIMNPPEAGSAVCRGAISFGAIDAEVMLSRRSRKTYGIAVSRPYRMDDPPDKMHITKDGRTFCTDVFDIFVQKGEDVPVNRSVVRSYVPLERSETSIGFRMYATSEPRPAYVTDNGVERVESWNYPLPLNAQTMDEEPVIEIEMFFGRTKIEVVGKPTNFQGKTSSMSVSLERDFV